jgi:DNA-binding response OmpR family regulator
VDDTSLPVIILSGRQRFADVRDGCRRGACPEPGRRADIYLTKPVKVGAVVAAVKWLLGGGNQPNLPQVMSAIVGSDS